MEAAEKFCGSCGAALTGAAAVPAERSPAAYTPKHLAEKILTLRAALEGERKQVTVLFVDVKGSMDLAARVDPEEWHRIMDRFFVILADGVHRFEGTVNQYTGDGIMALFGAPIAHEDHARRACYAALHLAEELRRYARALRLERGLDFAVRMGLNSGEVVVGRIGDDLRMDYTALGHTVGLAARMEQIAEVGKIYLTEHTAALVTGFFRLEELGPMTVKGVPAPLRVYELAGVGPLRTRLEVSRARGFSRFVGREDETATLEAALARAIAGDGQVVGVVGEAGVGKSRLCWEFVQRCRARGLAVYEAHGVSHGKLIPFLPVLELLRAFFGVTEQDGDQGARRKIAGTLVLLDEEFRAALPLVFEFLGVPDPERPGPRLDPETRQRELLGVVKQLVHAQGRRAPTVFLLEDLHWIDGGSEAFGKQIIETVPGTRTLLLASYRPEYQADWLHRSYCRQIPLQPLAADAIGELLRDLLGADPSLAGLAERVEERTRGNPFFIEEVVQALVETGNLAGSKGAYRLVRPVDAVVIPGTVQAVLAARIDRLPEREKGVLQTAAVIGKEFSEAVLRRVVTLPEAELAAALHALTGGEFVYERALYPTVEYGFRHPLTQEVAYRTQLAERRAGVHAAVARVVQELYADKLGERAALLAHHWEGAGDLLEAARWSSRAADWVGASNFPEAIRHWRKVRALVERLPESAETAELGRRARAEMLACTVRLGAPEEEIAKLLGEVESLGLAGWGDVRTRVILTAAPGAIRVVGGEPEAGLGPLLDAACLAEPTDDAGLKLAVEAMVVIATVFTGMLRDALARSEEVLAHPPVEAALGKDVFGFSPYVSLFMSRSIVLREMGRLVEAGADLDRSIALARAHGERELLASCYAASVDLAWLRKDAEGALHAARLAIETAEAVGSSFARTSAYSALGRAHMLREEWKEAADALERSLVLMRQSRTGLSEEAFKLASLAEVQLRRGDAALARRTAEEAVAAARRRHTRHAEVWAQRMLAHVALAGEGLAGRSVAEQALADASALIEQTGARAAEPFVHLERARLARLLGDEEGCGRELGEARRLFTAMGATERAEHAAGELT